MKHYFLFVLLNLYDKEELLIENYFTSIHDEELRWTNMAILINELEERGFIEWVENPFLIQASSNDTEVHFPVINLSDIRFTVKGYNFIENIIHKYDL